LAKAAGARPLLLDPDRQDYLTATLSHLPYLIACSLVQTAHTTTSNDPAAWRIVAGGFRDTSRVAGSDVRMMLDILSTNRDAVMESAAAFRKAFDHLVRLMETGSEEDVEAVLTHARAERRRMFP
jgi:prephenate dehydrogenase